MAAALLSAMLFMFGAGGTPPVFASGTDGHVSSDGRGGSPPGVKTDATSTGGLDLAILIQDDLTSRVGSELPAIKRFVTTLPPGSRVMIGYVGANTLSVRTPLTTDLKQAASGFRVLRSSAEAVPLEPYSGVVEALERLAPDGETGAGRTRAVLFISNGLDASGGEDASMSLESPALRRAIGKAREQGTKVFGIYAPGSRDVGERMASYGRNSLDRLTSETGGRSFGTLSGFVTFDHYLEKVNRLLRAWTALDSV